MEKNDLLAIIRGQIDTIRANRAMLNRPAGQIERDALHTLYTLEVALKYEVPKR